MDNFIKPEALKPGDKVAIVAPAGRVEKSYIDKSVSIFESWGLNVVLGKHLLYGFHQFAGTDTERLEDFQTALDAEDIRAVICARGGYGTIRIVDKINWARFKQAPKWVTGFSDITTIHGSIQNLGIQSLHSFMPINMKDLKGEDQPLAMFRDALFGESISYGLEPHRLNSEGTEVSPVVGGNLSLLYALNGSPFLVDIEHKILFLEDVGEQYYHIDRMMQSLRLSGVFEKINGLVVGGMTEMEDQKPPFGKSSEEIIAETVNSYDFPVVFGFPAGHQKNNLPIILGGTVALEASAQQVKIRFQ